MNQQMMLSQERAKRRRTFGPAYDPKLDAERLANQHIRIRDFMLRGAWWSLREIAVRLKYPEASISAQLRHLRKPEFGAYKVEKRRRNEGGTWEYKVSKEK